MIRIPVLQGFDTEKVIGWMEVDETKLPVTPDFAFELAYRIDDYIPDSYQIIAVSPVSKPPDRRQGIASKSLWDRRERRQAKG